jgi:hypothetical protein
VVAFALCKWRPESEGCGRTCIWLVLPSAVARCWSPDITDVSCFHLTLYHSYSISQGQENERRRISVASFYKVTAELQLRGGESKAEHFFPIESKNQKTKGGNGHHTINVCRRLSVICFLSAMYTQTDTLGLTKASDREIHWLDPNFLYTILYWRRRKNGPPLLFSVLLCLCGMGKWGRGKFPTLKARKTADIKKEW